MEILLNKEWKGNVRELENCIERAVLLAEDEMILPEHLFIDDMEPPNQKIAGFKPGMTVKDMEKRLIFGTLSQVNQNRTKAADILGISIRTLRNKLNQYKEEV
jgi:DNA-binding NtrC family response regulator